MKPGRKYTCEFKLFLLRELEAGIQLAQLSRENGFHSRFLGNHELRVGSRIQIE